jgi:hypothetical protein
MSGAKHFELSPIRIARPADKVMLLQPGMRKRVPSGLQIDVTMIRQCVVHPLEERWRQ